MMSTRVRRAVSRWWAFVSLLGFAANGSSVIPSPPRSQTERLGQNERVVTATPTAPLPPRSR